MLLGLWLSACSSPSVREAGAPIRIRWQRDPETLDPLALPNPQAIEAANLLHVGLLQLNLHTGTHSPALAEKLPTRRLLGDSLSEYDYQLRPEATWDDGRPILATDVAFTLKLMRCPELPNEAAGAQIDFIKDFRLDTANPRRITLICRGQVQDYGIASGDFPVLSEAAIDSALLLRRFTLPTLRQAQPGVAKQLAALTSRYQRLDAAHHPERLGGCGPYRLVQWTTNQSLTFERKPTWWADKLPQATTVLQARAQRLRYVIMPDGASATLALRRHEIDVLTNMPATDFNKLQKSAAALRELSFYTGASYDVVYAAFNIARPALSDRYTRQALGYLFDAQALLQATQFGQGVRTVGLLAPSSPFYNDSLALLPYAPDRAAALLRQGGWRFEKGGWWRPKVAEPLHVVFRYRAEDNMYATIGLQFRAAAARLGIAVELRPTEPSSFSQTLRAGDFDMYARTFKGNPFVYNFMPLLHSQAALESNAMRFGTPATDQLLLAIACEGQAARKQRLLRQLQVVLRREAPLVPLFYLPYRLAASRQLRHLVVSGLKPNYEAAALSWATSDSLVAAR